MDQNFQTQLRAVVARVLNCKPETYIMSCDSNKRVGGGGCTNKAERGLGESGPGGLKDKDGG